MSRDTTVLGNITYRALGLADLDQVMPIEQEGHAFPWSERVFRDCLSAGYRLDGVFTKDGYLLGFSMVMSVVDEWHILNLCVDPAYFRQGIGRYLMQKLMDQAPDAEIGSLWLEVRVGNIAARNLYAKLGFEEVGRRKGYYPAEGGREDAAVMRLALEPAD